jgi:hypothetical protein
MLKEILPVWYALAGYQLWTDRIDELDGKIKDSNATLTSLDTAASVLFGDN